MTWPETAESMLAADCNELRTPFLLKNADGDLRNIYILTLKRVCQEALRPAGGAAVRG